MMALNGPPTTGWIPDAKVTSVPITTGHPTQLGAINAALILCPRECQRNHIARCRVCTHLDAAVRAIR